MLEPESQLEFLMDDSYEIVKGKATVFDLETQKTFQEIGKRDPSKLLLALGVTLDLSTGEFKTFYEWDIDEIVEELCTSNMIIGFNSKSFDLNVLSYYTTQRLTMIPHLDIMEDLHNTLGFRPKLDSVAQSTIGAGKSGDGLQAIEWFKNGELDKIEKYCRQDVKITADVYQFGVDNGYVLVENYHNGIMIKVDVDWANPMERLNKNIGIVVSNSRRGRKAKI